MSADPTTLRALAARAEAGGDATLSDDVWRALGWEQHGASMAWVTEYWTHPDHTSPQVGELGPRPDLLASLDAQEEVGPTIVRVQVYPNSVGAWAVLETNLQVSRAHAPTEKLARLAAKLYALAAEAERAP